MNDLIAFDIDADHFARQLRPEKDRVALNALARRCLEYLRTVTTTQRLQPYDAPRVFHSVLRPAHTPAGPGFLLGIHARPGTANPEAAQLVGALNFIRPFAPNDTWYISLLLLEPNLRGQGLGAVVHRAFSHWAAVRGANRLMLSVFNNNPRAWHFWRDRMGYQEVPPPGSRTGGANQTFRTLQSHLVRVRTAAPWHTHRPADHLVF